MEIKPEAKGEELETDYILPYKEVTREQYLEKMNGIIKIQTESLKKLVDDIELKPGYLQFIKEHVELLEQNQKSLERMMAAEKISKISGRSMTYVIDQSGTPGWDLIDKRQRNNTKFDNDGYR